MSKKRKLPISQGTYWYRLDVPVVLKELNADEKGLSEIVSEVGKDFVDLIRYACVTPIDWWPVEKSHYSEREDYGYNEEAHQEFYDEADGYMVARPDGSAGV